MKYLKRLRRSSFERLPGKIDELDRFLSENEIIRSRGIGQGILTAVDAIRYSAAGPLLRASGIPYDVRRAEPYSIYDRLEFDVCTRKHGDVYDRLMLRFDEIRRKRPHHPASRQTDSTRTNYVSKTDVPGACPTR